jgi:hypothetical protein
MARNSQQRKPITAAPLTTNVIIYLNQSSERNMIDIPGCSERTNFKTNIMII